MSHLALQHVQRREISQLIAPLLFTEENKLLFSTQNELERIFLTIVAIRLALQ